MLEKKKKKEIDLFLSFISDLAVRDILEHFHIASINLMTNNPRKIAELSSLGINVVGRISAEVTVDSYFAAKYQYTKALSMGHLISSHHYEEAIRKGAGEMPVVLRFYEPDAENGFLSNFFPCELKIHGVTFKSTEHYYQSQKFAVPETSAIAEQIMNAATAAEAFAIARANDSKVRSDWSVHKKRTMFRALMYKFKLHQDLREKLLQTGDAMLVEDSKIDSFWGSGPDGKGQNLLGQMLSNIRLALREHNFDPNQPLTF